MHRLLSGLLALLGVGCSPKSETPTPRPGAVVTAEVLAGQQAKDDQVIRVLAEAGSNLSKPHTLEHHFVCPDRASAAPVVAWGRSAGYQPSPVTEGEFEGRRYVYFDLVKETVPTLANITPQTTAMLEIAAEHGVEYDGWGCTTEE